MEYIKLNTGANMPLVGLGTWNLRGQQCTDIVSKAIQLGYRLIDTAQMYDNEIEVGKGILQSGINRKELFITTKLYRNSNSYAKAKVAIERSLQNLQADYLDLCLIHEPYKEGLEMYKALEEAFEKGKIKAIGISNYDERRIQTFCEQCVVPPALNQVEAHLYHQRWALQSIMKENNVAMQAWSCLGQGMIDFSSLEVLRKLANKYNKTPTQIALRFLVQRNISVIPKSKTEQRLKENIDLFDFSLDREEMKSIQSLDQKETLFSWTKYL